MAEAVVDALEVVEIQIHERRGSTGADRMAHRLFEAVGEQASIREASKRVIEGELLHLLAAGLQIRYVGDLHDHVDGRAIRSALHTTWRFVQIALPSARR